MAESKSYNENPNYVPPVKQQRRRFTDEEVWEMRRQVLKGEVTYRELAEKYNVSIGLIGQAVTGIASYKGV